MPDTALLCAKLNDANDQVRRQALDQLVADWQAGMATVQPTAPVANMHCHTTYSYNGYGHFPASLAWMARQQGWYAMGTVDFDVLDAMDETLWALDHVRVRGAVGIETRVYHPRFSDVEINSPGEPGVMYHIGLGFCQRDVPAKAAATLAKMRQGAADRNREMVRRLNAHLDPVSIDYGRDVLPLTPSGNATERHLLIAYDVAARKAFPSREQLIDFWASRLGMESSAVDAFMGDTPFPHDQVRAKLMKWGGVGYMQPGPDTFPDYDEVTEAIIACGAVPVHGWLDGLSEGEKRIEEMLHYALAYGVAAINIVPDRNWNIDDAGLRATKITEMNAVIGLAQSLDLPVIVGTEMNKFGQPLVDDFDAAPLAPFRDIFMQGASFCHGHTVMQRALQKGYHSAWAQSALPGRAERVAFYTRMGELVEPGVASRARLSNLGVNGADAIVNVVERW